MADFDTGLCSCMDDCGLCIYTYFCPYCSMAANWAAIRGEACGCEHFCCFQNPYWTRQFIRSRKHMPKAACTDCMVATFCTECMICQDGRELKNGHGRPPPSEYFAGQQPLSSQQYAPAQGYPPQGYAAPPPQGYPQPQYGDAK